MQDIAIGINIAAKRVLNIDFTDDAMYYHLSYLN